MTGTEDLKRIKTLINGNGEKYYFVCNDAVHALSLLDLFDNLSVITYVRGPLTDALMKRGINLHFLLDEYPDYDRLMTTNNLISHDFIKKIMLSDKADKRNLIVFKNSNVVEMNALKYGFKLLMSGSKVSRGIENKVKFYDELKSDGVKVLPGKTLTISNNLKYIDIINKLGLPFVLQASKGFAGQNTHLIKREYEFDLVKMTYMKRKMRLTKFIAGETVTINACATRFGCVVKPPFQQLTGIDTLTLNEMGACGNYYDISSMDMSIRDGIIEETRCIGEMIYQKGYRGLFGVDYILSGADSYFVECNPRFVTSLPAFTRLELMRGEVPLLALHVLENLGRIDNIADIVERHKTFTGGYKGAQLILHNLSSDIKRIKTNFKCGIYTLRDGYLRFSRDALSIDELNSSDEMLIIAKAKGSTVNSGMECARILAKDPQIVYNKLDNSLQTAVNILYKKLI